MFSQHTTIKSVKTKHEYEYAIFDKEALHEGVPIDIKYRIVEIRDGITTIPSFAFRDARLDIVVLPPSMEIINRAAFQGSSIKELLVRKPGSGEYDPKYDNLFFIGATAFEDCKNLKVFEPTQVMRVNNFAFANSGLEEGDISFPRGAEINPFAFKKF